MKASTCCRSACGHSRSFPGRRRRGGARDRGRGPVDRLSGRGRSRRFAFGRPDVASVAKQKPAVRIEILRPTNHRLQAICPLYSRGNHASAFSCTLRRPASASVWYLLAHVFCGLIVHIVMLVWQQSSADHRLHLYGFTNMYTYNKHNIVTYMGKPTNDK